ncbi:MAG: KpsF/GutQ family sugar-phosphate isomerase [Abitibacteriaceae bacterium]|nr:KpsF/GutQ family sugar-phosphate isomerase [Abditibacteriaceae bacterium]
MSDKSVLEAARALFQLESEAIARLSERLDARFEQAVALLLSCQGRVVVTGIGKSGAIGRKIASTLASTGTPALFLHAAEGLHGDLGMVTPGDVLIAISYTGRTDELTSILPVVKEMGVPVIAITGNARAYLAAQADVMLDIAVEKEACPLNLAPTTSTVAALAMGDALAICAMQLRQFTPEKFARFHPGGALGRDLKLQVGELMRTGERLAQVPATATVRAAMQAITAAQEGAVVIVTSAGTLAGYLTDGDVRRRLLDCDEPKTLLDAPVATIMTHNPLTFAPDTLASTALRALQERSVDDAPVVDQNNVPVGILDVQELLRAGLL